MLRKKESYTVVTPIPGFIPRQLAIDILQSHEEVITLNPLVISHKPIPAPRDAVADEYYSTWYEITERVQFIPGVGRLGSSKVTFRGVFHDMPWGLQTHIYVPFGIDLRIRYRISGNQPGMEAPEQRELGLEALGAPKDGLYLREDIEIKGNISVVGMVKSQLKSASKEMVDRIIRKAELVDAGVLRAMMSEDGKLKTINPNDRSKGSPTTPGHADGRLSRPQSYQQGYGGSSPGQVPYARPATTSSYGYPGSPPPRHESPYATPMSPPPIPPKQTESPQLMELPGDYHHAPIQPPLGSPGPSPHVYAPQHYPPQSVAAEIQQQRNELDSRSSFIAELPAEQGK